MTRSTLYAHHQQFIIMPDQALPNPMVITLDHFNLMRENFKRHYFLSQCNPNFGGQEIQVPWNAFSLAVFNFISANSVDPNAVAIRFVHCYDVSGNVLYERMQILTMTPVQGHPHMFKLVDSPCEWYKLVNGTIVPTTDTALFDQDYLNYFYYCTALLNCTPSSLENLAKDEPATKYARTVTMPWGLEISKLFTDNGSPQNATLCIDAVCHLTILPPAAHFQHGLALYLRNADGTPMLDNKTGSAPFYYKAADYGTMCPPDCSKYILPML